jgi:spermidine synthase
VLKHKTVRRLTQVEIDAAVIAFSKRHFPEFTGPVFADKRFDSVIGDGMAYVASSRRRFDVIIVDSTDPQGPGAVLFTREFYAACKRCLNKGGVLVTQNGVPFFQASELRGSVGHFRALFADSACYLAAVPTYIGGHMAMGFATDDKRLRHASAKTIAARYAKAGRFPTKYWTPELHVGAFALPRFIADLIAVPAKSGRPAKAKAAARPRRR